MSFFAKYKKLFFIALAVFVFLLIVSQIFPTIVSISETQTRIQEVESRLAMLSEKENILKGPSQKTLLSQSQRLTEIIPETINLSSILATLQKVAADTGVTLGDFSIASDAQVISIIPVAADEKLSVFLFKISMTGSLNNIERFIEELGLASPIIRVVSIDFSESKSAMVLNAYFQPKKITSDSLRKLTDDHTEAMNDVFKLKPPVLQEESQIAAPDATREDPFR